MNVTLTKRLPTFIYILKDQTEQTVIDATGLTLNLKRIIPDGEDISIEIPLTNTLVNLPSKFITINLSYCEPFNINITDYEVDQINVILLNYINLINDKLTETDLI